jgi:hypothetical protein
MWGAQPTATAQPLSKVPAHVRRCRPVLRALRRPPRSPRDPTPPDPPHDPHLSPPTCAARAGGGAEPFRAPQGGAAAGGTGGGAHQQRAFERTNQPAHQPLQPCALAPARCRQGHGPAALLPPALAPGGRRASPARTALPLSSALVLDRRGQRAARCARCATPAPPQPLLRRVVPPRRAELL